MSEPRKQWRAQMRNDAGAADIWIYGDIGDFGWGDGLTAARFVEDLKGLGEVNEIRLHMNSGGGLVFDGIAIFNALRNHSASVTVYVDGLAASIASVIVQAADPGKLIIREGAMMMVHKPWSMAIGDAEDMRKEADTLDQIQAAIEDAYATRVNLSREELSAVVNDETWLTADEAVEFGFADSVDEPLVMAAHISLNKFHKPPSASLEVPAPPVTAQAGPMSATTDHTQQEEPSMATESTSANSADFHAAEQSRRASIRDVFAAGNFATKHRDLLDACLDDFNCTAEQAGKKLLDAIGADATPSGGDPIVAGADSRDKFKAGVINGLAARMGIEERDPRNEFGRISLIDVARQCLADSGENVRNARPDEIARKVLNAHTTSDFPEILADVANKRLRSAYEVAESVWDRFCYISEVPDFKAVKRPQLGAFSNLETIPEGGEYTFGTFNEESESITASTKGKGLKVTRQMLVNDDLGAFDRAAAGMGFAAARAVSRDVFSVLNANGDLSDAVALFATARGNLASSAAAISTSTLSDARAAMRNFQSGNDYLNLSPAFLLVPPAIEGVAREWMSSSANPTVQKNSGNVNVHAGSMEVLVDPYLSDTSINGSATAWYTIVNPMIAPLLEVAFLDGVRTPYTDDEVDFMSDCVLFKVRMDYGVAAIDWRGGYKNAGG